METILNDLKEIKPKNLKISDKYSANLYKYLNKTKHYHVYVDLNEGTFEKPKMVELDWNNLHKYSIYIGSEIMEDTYTSDDGKKSVDFGQVITKTLYSILNGRKLYQEGCYCGFGKTYVKRDFKEITDEFWGKYKEIGRCLFISHDETFIKGNENRYTYLDENTRICNWCGKKQYKHIERETKIIEHIKWEDK